ncbi:RHS repeat-associated core domain-containing protein|uniref:RHS repeat-associated core domain-containing protein n=1 Tax=Pseudomonas sp. SbOxS1 TaxID=2723884 RepID=UPI0015D3C033|nr:RHS repeat-associated core domain-containing protein [Pseudomonas sp. SbOxS1]NYU03478.1 RHS repeat-associated core domain-containing protein [Pseudomonas sp. SbOxS1]
MTQLKPVDQKTSTWQRTTLLATDNSQSIIGEIVDGEHTPIAYTAYGEQSAPQEDKARLGFNGQLREGKIGWYLLGNGYRAYNPRLMRFHSPDSWSPFGGGGLNAYMYCVGDPVNRSDPTGHVPWIEPSVKKIFKNTFNFFFGGAGMTGPNRSKALTATRRVEDVAGPMRPTSENLQQTLGKIGTYVGGAPGARAHPDSRGLDYGTTTSRVHPGYAAGAAADGLTRRSTRSSPQTSIPGGGGHHTPDAPRLDGPPPSYSEAMSLWNAGTFAQSQQGRTFVVNRAAVPNSGNYLELRAPQPDVQPLNENQHAPLVRRNAIDGPDQARALQAAAARVRARRQ